MGIEVNSSQGCYAMVDDLECSPHRILRAITWLRHHIPCAGPQCPRHENSLFSLNLDKLALINIPSSTIFLIPLCDNI